MKIAILLDEDDFRCLVSGGILSVKKNDNQIDICLSDIGFNRMDRAIEDADSGQLPHYSDRTKEL